MEVEILAFGATRDIVGGSSFKVSLAQDDSVADLKNQLYEQYPKMRKLRSLMVAVNNEYAEDDLQLSGKEEIALIPPVSGG